MNHTQPFTPKPLLQQLQESVVAKLLLIAFLILLLLIPSSWVQSLISEREQRRDEATAEITDKWSGAQSIQSAVLQLPYKTMIKTFDAAGKPVYKDAVSTIYILPESLVINASVTPETLKRGLFDAIVYNAAINVKGKFSNLEIKKSGINPKMIIWEKAKMVSGLTDLKGLKSNPVIKIGNNPFTAEPDFSPENLFENNLSVPTDLTQTESTDLNFSYDLDLRGSTSLNFIHLGKNTVVNLNGKWDNPSFTGNFLPEKRNVDKTFTSTWKVSNFNRPFPQQWQDDKQILNQKSEEKASFGVKFLLPVDEYQKTMRCAKYSILVILLSFISLFFIELIRKIKIDILQYTLIGAAMIIYYGLLLSFTEQIGFTAAYLTASAATIILVSSFVGAFLKNRKSALIFAFILTIFYSFIFIIIQLQDLSLLFGSVGLFVTVACLMYFSVKISSSKTQPSIS